MILEPGLKLLVAHRRLFENDRNRYFVGVVEGYDAGVARVTGFTWTRDPYTGEFERKADERTKILALASGTLLVYQLPSTVQPETATIESDGTSVKLLGPGGFAMDLSEGSLVGGGVAPPRLGASPRRA